MRLIVLDRSPHGNVADVVSSDLLCAAARARGAEPAHVPFANAADPALERIRSGDVVLVRADLRSPADLVCVADAVWHLEQRGVRCLPSAEGLVAAEDKFRTFVRLRRANVNTIPTVAVVPGSAATDGYVSFQSRLQAFPVVLKRPVGWGGLGTERCDDARAFAAALERHGREQPEAMLLVQPFVPHERTLTVLVAGDRAMSAWSARPTGTEFRSNPGLGGVVSDARVDDAVAHAAVEAVRACALEFASVEFIEVPSEPPAVIEVNAMPGLWADDADDAAFADAIVALALGTP